METCIAKQPIFNRKLNIFGYELLYRETASSLSYTASDGDSASSKTIMHSFHEIGIERITGGKRAFINFTEKLILDRVATILPNKVLVVELLETISPSPSILDACTMLQRQGYMIALDDFIFEADYMPLLAVADIVKVDFLSTPMEKIKLLTAAVKKHPVRLLAEKLETQEAFETALEMGFSLFQGYFFSKPVIVPSDTKLTPLKVNCIQLIRLALEPNVNFTKIADIIKHDVALSYRLLRVVNSAFFGLRYTVKNIRQALAILGMDEVKKWITLISLAEMKDNKPDELIRMSLLRAKMMELLAPKANLTKSIDDLFMLGLMSLMDAIMDLPIDEIVSRTNISPNIAHALVTHEGDYGRLLSLVICYERSYWDEAFALAEQYNISPQDLFNIYMAAIDWSNQL